MHPDLEKSLFFFTIFTRVPQEVPENLDEKPCGKKDFVDAKNHSVGCSHGTFGPNFWPPGDHLGVNQDDIGMEFFQSPKSYVTSCLDFKCIDS